MQMKTILGTFTVIASVVVGHSVAKQLTSSSQQPISADAYDASIVAEMTTLNKTLPLKMQGRDGQPITMLSVTVTGRTVTWTIRADDPAEYVGLAQGDWDAIEAAIVAGMCVEKPTRMMLNRNYLIVYRLLNHKDELMKQLPPFGVADCPKA